MQSLSPVSNGAASAIDATAPYIASVTIEGVAPILFHAWNCEAVEAKGKAAKNSKAKKTDDVESYLYRTEGGYLGVPGANFHATLIEAGRYMQDPRSPRKSARDLVKAGVISLDTVAPFVGDLTEPDFIDQRRVQVQRSGITRMRPALRPGWRITFSLLINTPEYLEPPTVQQLIVNAGRLVGLCDFRPTYGRFNMVGFSVESAA